MRQFKRNDTTKYVKFSLACHLRTKDVGLTLLQLTCMLLAHPKCVVDAFHIMSSNSLIWGL